MTGGAEGGCDLAGSLISTGGGGRYCRGAGTACAPLLLSSASIAVKPAKTTLHFPHPGLVNQAYRAFHNYSIGNQMLAAVRLAGKGMALAPIASFNAWREKGRFVKKGEKAISLFMPINVKRRGDKAMGKCKGEGGGARAEDGVIAGSGTFSLFTLRPHWFSLDQTEGAEFIAESVTPTWDAATAMAALDIVEVPFRLLQGNCLGYASARSIAISPLNALKHKTRFHEMAHVVLGHTAIGDMQDDETLTRQVEEA